MVLGILAMPFELSQEFTFDADVPTVHAFIMEYNDALDKTVSPHIEVSDGFFACRCYFLEGDTHKALHTIILSMALQSDSRKFEFKSWDNWLVWDREIGEIVLTQDQKGFCKASFYVEASARNWGDTNLSMQVGRRFVGYVWRRIIEDWTAQAQAGEAQAAPGEPTARVAEQGQLKAKTHEELKDKRIFGFRIRYLILGIMLTILIACGSLIAFPDWAKSNFALVILIAIAFSTATTLIANFRKAYE